MGAAVLWACVAIRSLIRTMSPLWNRAPQRIVCRQNCLPSLDKAQPFNLLPALGLHPCSPADVARVLAHSFDEHRRRRLYRFKLRSAVSPKKWSQKSYSCGASKSHERITALSEKCSGEVIRKITCPRPTSRRPNEAMHHEGKSYN